MRCVIEVDRVAEIGQTVRRGIALDICRHDASRSGQ
jgi:hypothetical protein